MAAIFGSKTIETDANMWTAAADGDIHAVLRHISEGVDINAADEHGFTALYAHTPQRRLTPVTVHRHAASSYGHADLLRQLLEMGASVTTTDEDGDTPLHGGCQRR